MSDNPDILIDIPNPIAQPILEKWNLAFNPQEKDSPKRIWKISDPVTELKSASVDYSKLSEVQKGQLTDAVSYQTSHRPDDLYSFLERDDYLPSEAVQKGLKDGLMDIVLNAPKDGGGQGYPESWVTLLSSVRVNMEKIGKLTPDTRKDVAVSLVGKISEGTLSPSGVAGNGQRNSSDIPTIVGWLVDRGDVATIDSIKSIVSSTADQLDKATDSDSKWKKDHAQWVRDKVLPRLEEHKTIPDTIK